MREYYSPVAQLVEQVTVNHWVGGSSPSRGANKIHGLQLKAQSLLLLLRVTNKSPAWNKVASLFVGKSASPMMTIAE